MTTTMTGTRIVAVTPEIAAEWLSHNTMNRAPINHAIEEYTRAIREGKWVINGETIKFAADGTLLDGQNRLMAVVKSGCTVRMEVREGLDKGAFSTIDCGRKRRAGDVLSIIGHTCARNLAAAANLALVYDRTRAVETGGRSTQAHEILAYVESNPRIIDAVRESARLQGTIVARMSVLSWFLFEMTRRGLFDPAIAFLEAVAYGEGLTREDPEYVLRERLIQERKSKSRLRSRMEATFLVKAWNARRSGRTIKALRMSEGEAFPEIIS